MASRRCASWLASKVRPTTSGIIPKLAKASAGRAERQWRNTYSKVNGGRKLAQPHSRPVAKARITSQTNPASISSKPPRISSASIQ